MEALFLYHLTDSDFGFATKQTWPRLSDLSADLQRDENLSTSVPLREATPGGAIDGSGLPGVRTHSGSHQQCFSVPGPIYKQGISDECLLYNINDSPKKLAGKIWHLCMYK